MKLRDASCRLSSTSSEGGILKRNLIKNVSYILICSHIQHSPSPFHPSQPYIFSLSYIATHTLILIWSGDKKKAENIHSHTHCMHTKWFSIFFSFFKNRFSRKNVDDRNFRFSFRLRFFSNHLFVSEKPTDRQT